MTRCAEARQQVIARGGRHLEIQRLKKDQTQRSAFRMEPPEFRGGLPGSRQSPSPRLVGRAPNQGPFPPLALPSFIGVGSEEARPKALASVRRSNGTCSFPACRFHEGAACGRERKEGISEKKLTSPSSPRSRGAGSVVHPRQRHRL